MNYRSFPATIRNARGGTNVRIGSRQWRGAWEHDGEGSFRIPNPPANVPHGETTADFIFDSGLGVGFYRVPVNVEGFDDKGRLIVSHSGSAS